MPLLVAELTTSVLFGHVHYRAPHHPRYDALAETLRVVVLSGAKVSEELFAAAGRGGAWVGQLFGMAEGLLTVSPRDGSPFLRRTTVGVPVSPLDEVRVLEPGGEDEVPDGEVGELCCRGPYTLRGYYGVDRPEAFTSDGFYRTGDLACVRVLDGYRAISIEGRIKDLINRGGEKINAEEVESLLTSHPAIDEAALVAMPDDRLGERACAFVHSAAGQRPTIHDIRDYLDSLGVAKYKWPERIEWVDDMPRASQLGKLDKKRLRVIAQDLSPEPVPKSAPVSNTRHN
jgi:2,3-dihydroxybenzoate-AMP ligase